MNKPIDMVIRELCFQIELISDMSTRERLVEIREGVDFIEKSTPEDIRICYDWFIRVGAICMDSACALKGALPDE